MSQTVAMKTLYGAVASLHNAAHLLAIQDNQAQALVRSYNLLDAETAKTKRKLAKAERELTKYRKKAAIKSYKARTRSFMAPFMTVMAMYRDLMCYGYTQTNALAAIKRIRAYDARP